MLRHAPTKKNRHGTEPLPYIGDEKKSSDVGRMLRHAPTKKKSSWDRAPALQSPPITF